MNIESSNTRDWQLEKLLLEEEIIELSGRVVQIREVIDNKQKCLEAIKTLEKNKMLP